MGKCGKCICKKCVNTCRCAACDGENPVLSCDEHKKYKQIKMFDKQKQVLPRFVSWEEYGISKERRIELRDMCQSGKYDALARSAAYTANKDIAEYILLSVKNKYPYELIEYAPGLGRIPCGRTDFYGYRRLFFHYFDLEIKMVQKKN